MTLFPTLSHETLTVLNPYNVNECETLASGGVADFDLTVQVSDDGSEGDGPRFDVVFTGKHMEIVLSDLTAEEIRAYARFLLETIPANV